METFLTLVRTLQAPAHEVFKAWTDPALLNRWMSTPGSGTAKAEVDPRVGGRYRFEMRTPDGQVHVTTGVYKEVEPDRRLVHTWVYSGPHADFVGHETLLTVELREVESGVTELTLKHERLPSDAYRTSVNGGWTALLGNLAALYAAEPVGPSRQEA